MVSISSMRKSDLVFQLAVYKKQPFNRIQLEKMNKKELIELYYKSPSKNIHMM